MIRKWRLLDHLFSQTGQAGAGDIDVQPLHVDGSVHSVCQFKFGIAWRRVGFVILEAVQVLVSFSAHLAAEGLLLLHADSAGVGHRCFGIDDGEGPVCVFVKLLVCMTVLQIQLVLSHGRIGITLTYCFVIF